MKTETRQSERIPLGEDASASRRPDASVGSRMQRAQMLACLLVVYLAGRSFLSRGAPGLLLLGCGVAIWGGSGFLATCTLTNSDANLGVTISNLGIWLAALCHLTGVVLSLRVQRTPRLPRFWLGLGYASALGVLGLITLLTFAHKLPVFFVEGQGGTPVRHVVLGAALVLFALTAVLLWEGNRPSLSPFTYWYTLALLLIAAGISGMILQSSRNSMLNWTCRVTQYLSGIYMLIAAIASMRESGVPNPIWEFPRLCRGGSSCLTFPGVHRGNSCS